MLIPFEVHHESKEVHLSAVVMVHYYIITYLQINVRSFGIVKEKNRLNIKETELLSQLCHLIGTWPFLLKILTSLNWRSPSAPHTFFPPWSHLIITATLWGMYLHPRFKQSLRFRELMDNWWTLDGPRELIAKVVWD